MISNIKIIYMIITLTDWTEVTTDLLIDSQIWSHRGVNLDKVKRGKKYDILDWSELSLEGFNLSSIDEDVLVDYILGGESVNNRTILYEMFKSIEMVNEEFLWSSLVDSNHLSNELYMLNTYEENFNLFFKTVKHHLPLKK